MLTLGTSLLVWWLRLYTSQAGGLGSIPGQGTHMLQLRIPMVQLRPDTAK